MARAARIRVSGGWYHVCSRGHNREGVFSDATDYSHFVDLLEEMRERFRVRLYAYCLMPNHYHLLMGTPQGNISRAMQWLNGSYGIWHNRRHQRTGHLMGDRYKGILVEGAVWGLQASVYIHTNPVATEAMGLGKRQRAAQRRGLAAPPTPEEVARRLGVLRSYAWTSYRAYAGYRPSPRWLDRDVLLKRAGKDGEASYRELVESRIRQGVEEDLGSKVRWGLILGGERFAKKVRGRIRVHREHAGRNEWKRQKDFEEIVAMVERIKGEKWAAFRDRYGDWGRDLALWAGRLQGGLSLRALGELAGGMDYGAVALAVRRLSARAQKDRATPGHEED